MTQAATSTTAPKSWFLILSPIKEPEVLREVDVLGALHSAEDKKVFEKHKYGAGQRDIGSTE